MSTVINNPSDGGGNNASGASGVLIGAVVVVIMLIIGVVLALPYIRGRLDRVSEPVRPTINVQLPDLPVIPTPAPTPAPTQ